MSAAGAAQPGPGPGANPSGYLASGCKMYKVQREIRPSVTHSQLCDMISDDDALSIRQRLELDEFYLGALLLQGVDENINFCQPFFLYQVHGRGAYFSTQNV